MRHLEAAAPGINAPDVAYLAAGDLYAAWLLAVAERLEVVPGGMLDTRRHLRDAWLSAYEQGPQGPPRVVPVLQPALHITRRHDPTYGQFILDTVYPALADGSREELAQLPRIYAYRPDDPLVQHGLFYVPVKPDDNKTQIRFDGAASDWIERRPRDYPHVAAALNVIVALVMLR